MFITLDGLVNSIYSAFDKLADSLVLEKQRSDEKRATVEKGSHVNGSVDSRVCHLYFQWNMITPRNVKSSMTSFLPHLILHDNQCPIKKWLYTCD